CQDPEIFLALCAGKTQDDGSNKNRSCILQCTILLCQKDMNSSGIFEENTCENTRRCGTAKQLAFLTAFSSLITIFYREFDPCRIFSDQTSGVSYG
uniref:Uncharacterized protein n=1 Tax=Romanomermis culicivorax TaxID=13658 RepID=A0A915JFD2_ROMCU